MPSWIGRAASNKYISRSLWASERWVKQRRETAKPDASPPAAHRPAPNEQRPSRAQTVYEHSERYLREMQLNVAALINPQNTRRDVALSSPAQCSLRTAPHRTADTPNAVIPAADTHATAVGGILRRWFYVCTRNASSGACRKKGGNSLIPRLGYPGWGTLSE